MKEKLVAAAVAMLIISGGAQAQPVGKDLVKLANTVQRNAVAPSPA